MTPIFLSLADVIALHREIVDRYGGDVGVLDPGRLEAAVAQPAMSFSGTLLHPHLLDQAAAYLFHLVANHPFCDGNKRIGLLAALVFLERNGATIGGTADAWHDLTLAVADGSLKKRGLTERMRALVGLPGSQPRKP